MCQPEPAGLFPLSYNTIIAKVVGFWKGRFTSITLGRIIRLLIYILRNDFEGDRKVALETREKKSEFLKPLLSNLKKVALQYRTTFFRGGPTRKKIHFSPTWKKRSELTKSLFTDLKKIKVCRTAFLIPAKWYEFSLKVKVMGSNPDYLLKSFLLLKETKVWLIHFNLIFTEHTLRNLLVQVAQYQHRVIRSGAW